MKKQLLNIGQTLTKAEQQQINGGTNTCAYYNSQAGPGEQAVQYGMSSSAAQGALAHPDDHWCCESCSTASWYNPNGIDSDRTRTIVQ